MLRRFVRVVQIFALVATALASALLFRPQSTPDISTLRMGSDGSMVLVVDGAVLYADRCAGCHGEFGQGTYAPELRNGLVVAAYPDANAQVAVVTGGKGTMRAFGQELTAQQIAAVVAYTRKL